MTSNHVDVLQYWQKIFFLVWVRDSQIPFARSPWRINSVRWHLTFWYCYYGICCVSPFGVYNFEVSLRFLEKLYTPVVGNDDVLNYQFEPHFSVSSPKRNNCSSTNYIETTHQSQPNSHCFQNLIHITRSDRPGHIQVTQNVYKTLRKVLAIERCIKRN
jgi:hypothetical protein